MLIEQSCVLVQIRERRIGRRALSDEPAQAVRDDARPPTVVEDRLQRLLPCLLGLEAGPLVMPGAALSSAAARSARA